MSYSVIAVFLITFCFVPKQKCSIGNEPEEYLEDKKFANILIESMEMTYLKELQGLQINTEKNIKINKNSARVIKYSTYAIFLISLISFFLPWIYPFLFS